LSVALTFVLMYELLARELRPTVALGTSVVACLFASKHFIARPHLLSFPIIVIWTAALARSADQNRPPSFWLLPFVTLWANLHGGFTLGLLLVCAFGLEATLAVPSGERRHVALRWVSFGIGAALAACVTPYGYLYVLQTYHVLDLGEVMQHVGELRPANAY